MNTADRITADALDRFVAELGTALPPENARAAFRRVVHALAERIDTAEARPYVHGDPRVDRWQIAPGSTNTAGGRLEPLTGAPDGFEPLAAWSFLPAIECWERPLRRVPKEPDR